MDGETPSTSHRILYDVPCAVCRDHSSGKHYGVFACDGCAGFFKRSVRRDRRYTCKARSPGLCLVDKAHRNQCRACRLAKCLDVGMNPDAVQHERGPRNSTIRRQIGFLIENIMAPSPTSPPPPLQTPQLNMVMPDLLQPLGLLPPPPPPPPPSVLYPTAVHLTPNYLAPFPFTPQIRAPSRVHIPPTFFNGMSTEELREGAAKLLFLNVKWAKNLAAFQELSMSDRLLLLEETWKALFIIGAAQFLHPLEVNHLISGLRLELNLEEAHELDASIRALAAMQPDANEFSCLRALALFKTTLGDGNGNSYNAYGLRRRLQDIQAVAATQNSSLIILTEWCSRTGDSSRAARFLQLLQRISSVSTPIVVELFFRDTIGNVSMETVLTNMYCTGYTHA